MVENSILIVDDHPASRMYLANFLKVKEFKVLEGPTTGKEGLIAAWRDAPDLVLFDPALTDISDRGFIHKLRNDPRTSRTPLVALSSDPAPARKQTCLNAGGEKGSSLIVFLSAKGGNRHFIALCQFCNEYSKRQTDTNVVVADRLQRVRTK